MLRYIRSTPGAVIQFLRIGAVGQDRKFYMNEHELYSERFVMRTHFLV